MFIKLQYPLHIQIYKAFNLHVLSPHLIFQFLTQFFLFLIAYISSFPIIESKQNYATQHVERVLSYITDHTATSADGKAKLLSLSIKSQDTRKGNGGEKAISTKRC